MPFHIKTAWWWLVALSVITVRAAGVHVSTRASGCCPWKTRWRFFRFFQVPILRTNNISCVWLCVFKLTTSSLDFFFQCCGRVIQRMNVGHIFRCYAFHFNTIAFISSHGQNYVVWKFDFRFFMFIEIPPWYAFCTWLSTWLICFNCHHCRNTLSHFYVRKLLSPGKIVNQGIQPNDGVQDRLFFSIMYTML